MSYLKQRHFKIKAGGKGKGREPCWNGFYTGTGAQPKMKHVWAFLALLIIEGFAWQSFDMTSSKKRRFFFIFFCKQVRWEGCHLESPRGFRTCFFAKGFDLS